MCYQFMHELAHLVTKAGSAQRERGHADRAGPDRRGHDRQPADHGHHRRLRDLRLALDLEGHPDQPEWLSHVNAGVLKVKLAVALIGISSIHLLRPSSTPPTDDRVIKWQVAIHACSWFPPSPSPTPTR
jgi:hypothetical protein